MAMHPFDLDDGKLIPADIGRHWWNSHSHSLVQTSKVERACTPDGRRHHNTTLPPPIRFKIVKQVTL
jgi:hypothetical protein